MMNGKEYLDSIRRLKTEVYIDGTKKGNILDLPQVRPAAMAVAKTYDLQCDPKLEHLFMTKSHLTGEPISIFQHVPQCAGDVMQKLQVTRFTNRELGTCSFRCIQNSFVPLLAVTKKMDEDLGTRYHENLVNWIIKMQREDLLACPCLTDPKGHRKLKAHQQPDPDMYLRIVKKDKDGIVLRGAKVAQTGALFSHYKLVTPCISHGPGDEDYAVCCAIPTDAPGLIHIAVKHSQEERRIEGVDLGNLYYGVHECIVVFDDVFVPWDHVFMAGEVQYLPWFIDMLSVTHRPTTGACKAGWADVLVGATQEMAWMLGLESVAHIKDKLYEMISKTETIWSCAVAAACTGYYIEGAGYLSNPVLSNNTKYIASRNVFDLIRMAEEVTGNMLSCCPSEKEMNNPEIKPYLDRFLKGRDEVSAQDRIRMVRLIENLSWGMNSILHSAAHGGGSGDACKIQMGFFALQDEIRKKGRENAKKLCGILPLDD